MIYQVDLDLVERQQLYIMIGKIERCLQTKQKGEKLM